MSYYRRSSYYGGRYRSEAYRMDGGANDEGYHNRYCSACARSTEHGISEGCIPCGDKAIQRRRQSLKKK